MNTKVVNLANKRPKETDLVVLKQYSMGAEILLIDPSTHFEIFSSYNRDVIRGSVNDIEKMDAIHIARLLALLTPLNRGLILPLGLAPTVAVRQHKETKEISVYASYLDIEESKRVQRDGLPFTDAVPFLTLVAEYVREDFDLLKDDEELKLTEPALNKEIHEKYRTNMPIAMYRRLIELVNINRAKFYKVDDIFIVTIPWSPNTYIRVSIRSQAFDI